MASRRERATAQGIQVAERLSPAQTSGDPRLVESLVVNLVENALRHNHPGGFMNITTETAGDHAILSIVNSGPFTPSDQLERLLRPFQRLSLGRSHRHDGYGLGLAIVNSISNAHHATLDIRARPAGGLHITVGFVASTEGRNAGAATCGCRELRSPT